MRRKLEKDKKKVNRKLFATFIIFGIVLGALAVELIFRLLPSDVLKIDISPQIDTRIFSATRDYKYKPNTARNFTGLGPPTIWHFNNYGFRDRAFETNEVLGNIFRIIFIGDSMVMGLGVEDYEAFPRQLERVLQPKKYSSGITFFEVFNLGLWGSYASQTYEAVLKEVGLELKPDLVILGFFAADVSEAAANKKREKYYRLRSLPDTVVPYKLNELLKRHSYFYLFLLNRYYNLIKPYQPQITFSKELEEEGWKITEEKIGNMKQLSLNANVEFLLVGIPSIHEVLESNSERYVDREQRLELIADKYGLYYIDLVERLKGYRDKKELYIDGIDTHFSPKGNQVVAGIIADYLRENQLVPE